jgi:hypothetical protein
MSTSPWSRVKPSSASPIAGAISADRAQAFDDMSVLVEEHVAARGTWRLLAKIEEGLTPIGKLDGHEAAAAEIAGGRIDHGERISDRDRSIDGIAATLENVDPDIGRKVLCRDHHAMFGGHGPLGGGVGGSGERQRAQAGKAEGGDHRPWEPDTNPG